MKKINKKHLVIAGIVSFIFIFIYEMLVHGYLLMGMYDQTPQLWRAVEDMSMVFGILVQLISAFLLVCLFMYMGVKDMKSGMMAGLHVGVPFAFMGGFAIWGYMPISMALAIAWFVVILVKVVAVGKITGAVVNFKKKGSGQEM